MGSLVPLALYGFPLVALVLFVLLGARRAVAVAHVAGWAFLPVATIDLPALDYDKAAAIGIGCALGVLLFDLPRLLALRPQLTDLAVLATVAAPMASSLANGLGAYDGLVNALGRVFLWGLPYLFGRLYFADRDGLVELARAFVWGGLVYVPLCLWELRMSPQLHAQVYGYYAHASGFTQVVRFGGWRPTVFMHHGLMLGLWMASATVVAAGLALLPRTREQRFLGLRALHAALLLLAVTVLCKSSASIAWAVAGCALLWLGRRANVRPLAVALAVLPLVYVVVRTADLWSGAELVELVELAGAPDRAESLDYRFEAERLLADKALEQPLFGWGGYMRGFVPWERSVSGFVVPDGLWTLYFNMNGLLGLGGLLGMLLAPLWAALRSAPGPAWCRAALAPRAALGLVVALFAVDCLLNAMVVPLVLVAAGAVCGSAAAARARQPVRARAGERVSARWSALERALRGTTRGPAPTR
jgi:hypothetical protein